jgi:phosphatidylserine/phosphatidylglycerophosphate/cardiolipin synthase-like enzyme
VREKLQTRAEVIFAMSGAVIVQNPLPKQKLNSRRWIFLTRVVLSVAFGFPLICHGASKRQSAEEWLRLNATNAPPPRVVAKPDEIRFYFPRDPRQIGFTAELERSRLPTEGYQVSSSLLRLHKKLAPVNPGTDGWKEPVVIAGDQWRRLATNLLAGLTPATPGHAKYYRGVLGERILYRDSSGRAMVVPLAKMPKGVSIDHRYSIEESLQILAQVAEPLLTRKYPGKSLFLLMVHPKRSPQPLFIDTAKHLCVWISSSALFEPKEPSIPLTPTFRGVSALVFESNGLALLKNPVSSIGRLGNLVFQTISSLIRVPFPKASGPVPLLAHSDGMSLTDWEDWLDAHTGTPREYGSLRLLIDGERFFPRFLQSVTNAAKDIRLNVYMFDNDEVGVETAEALKQRSSQVPVEVIYDRLATMTAGHVPPITPPSKPFVPPTSISDFLEKDSKVKTRPFLNPFCSYDHSKVYLIDGKMAWMGGMNIGQEYRSEWHDMMVEMQGPIVGSLDYNFRLNWAHVGWLGDLAYLHALLTTPKPSPTVRANGAWIQMRLLPTKTTRKPFAKAVLHSLQFARKYIYVENPYLFDKQVMSDLVRARRRGVDVRVIIPHVNDSHTGGRAELVAANYLVQHGVRVFFYPGMTHVKAVLVDDWACVGSGNLNQFGLKLCQEHNVATSDPVFAHQLKHDLFEEDFTHCYELSDPIAVEWMDFVADFVLEDI